MVFTYGIRFLECTPYLCGINSSCYAVLILSTACLVALVDAVFWHNYCEFHIERWDENKANPREDSPSYGMAMLANQKPNLIRIGLGIGALFLEILGSLLDLKSWGRVLICDLVAN